jgi:hypothetical protein
MCLKGPHGGHKSTRKLAGSCWLDNDFEVAYGPVIAGLPCCQSVRVK